MERRVLRIAQGADFTATFTVPGLSPLAVVTAEIRRWRGSERIGRFSARVHPGTGTLTISLTEIETARLKRSGEYDIFVSNGAVTQQIAYGPAVVVPRVSTRPSTVPAETGMTLDEITQPVDNLSDDLTWENI